MQGKMLLPHSQVRSAGLQATRHPLAYGCSAAATDRRPCRSPDRAWCPPRPASPPWATGRSPRPSRWRGPQARRRKSLSPSLRARWRSRRRAASPPRWAHMHAAGLGLQQTPAWLPASVVSRPARRSRQLAVPDARPPPCTCIALPLCKARRAARLRPTPRRRCAVGRLQQKQEQAVPGVRAVAELPGRHAAGRLWVRPPGPVRPGGQAQRGCWGGLHLPLLAGLRRGLPLQMGDAGRGRLHPARNLRKAQHHPADARRGDLVPGRRHPPRRQLHVLDGCAAPPAGCQPSLAPGPWWERTCTHGCSGSLPALPCAERARVRPSLPEPPGPLQTRTRCSSWSSSCSTLWSCGGSRTTRSPAAWASST